MSKRNRILKVILCWCLITVLMGTIETFAIAKNVKTEGNATVQKAEDIIFSIEKECTVGTRIEFDLIASQQGKYELELQYITRQKYNPIMSIRFDGKIQIEEASRIEFYNNWISDKKIRKDDKGNEIAPDQILSDKEVKCVALNRTGLYEFPYLFELKEGDNKISIEVFQGEFFLSAIRFKEPENTPSYKEWLSNHNIKNNTKNVITIEAENALIKNDRALIPLSDSTSANISPASAVIKKLNYIGGSNWSTVGDEITWEFNCKEQGYYYFGFQYKQDAVINGVSYRHLKIDGRTPFAEANRVKFEYTPSWEYYEYGNGTNPYLVFLEKGKHTISLTVTAGELSSVYSGLSDVVANLGELYIDITMIIGETVDNNRTYELFNQIPNFNKRLDQYILELNQLIKTIEKLQGESNGSLVSNIISAVETLEQMRENPYSAHRYKSAYYTAYTNLSATLGTLTNMPLDLDRIFVVGNNTKSPDVEISFWNKFLFSAKRFIMTFTEDYNNFSANSDKEITLWVNWGRDQAQVLNAIIMDDFTPKHGINVNVKVTNASIIQGILAGKGPDVMLHMSRVEPINLAMRGALVDLSSFEDFDEVVKNFAKDATKPYEYKGQTYALPDTQGFYMMFVRTDIFDEFGLEIPKTWEEFLEVAAVLQRNNLQVCVPYTQISSSTTVNVGVGGLSLYPTLLMQNGLSLYNDDLSKTNLTESKHLNVFTEWCEWYTKYKVPKVMDFYNRFRIGSTPIGISSYTLITQIKATCPEIEGNWKVTTIPGTKRDDGTIDYTSSGSGTGCAITKLSENPELAWEFLKWWTSAETQVEYSNNLESYLGPLGRVATSNIQAIDEIGWDMEHLPVIMDQMENVSEIEEIPGGYYTARGIDQAFWNVVEQSKKPKDMLIEWGEIVNREIERKKKEYD